jgi:hypothetical protein
MSSVVTTSGLVLAAALGGGVGPGCAPLRLPDQTSGPAISHEGVQVAVTRQSCTENVDPDFYGQDLVEEVVEVAVRNATPDPVIVQRDAFRLIAPDGPALKTITWNAVDPLALAGGELRTFELRFMTRGALACDHEMKLDSDAGVRINGQPVRVGAIPFVPSRAL